MTATIKVYSRDVSPDRKSIGDVVDMITAECGIEDEWNSVWYFGYDAKGQYVILAISGLKKLPDEQRNVIYL